jgi:hypothetical protein
VCLAYTGTFSPLRQCPFCGERRYEKHQNIDPKVPRRQFITLPLGPQLQALWRHPVSVAKLRDRVRRTKSFLAPRNTDGGVQDIMSTSAVAEITLIMSNLARFLTMTCFLFFLWMIYIFTETKSRIHGLALIATLINFAPEIRHAKEMVLPTFMIGSPNAPKNYDSFLFPTFAHLSAFQKLGLQIWDTSTLIIQ